jgi:PPP family 3-phenylpropionic acid transporter
LWPARAAIQAAFAGVTRWSVLGATAQIVPLMLVEPLHGLTFALFHLAAMGRAAEGPLSFPCTSVRLIIGNTSSAATSDG